MKNNKTALITGITGFVGSHLAEYLLSKKFEVWGLSRWRSRTENIDNIKSKLKLIEADLLDLNSLQRAVKESNPTHIFHLGAQSYVGASLKSPVATLEVNIIGTCNLLEAVRETGIDPLIQVACTSDEYGLVKESEIPIKETNPLRPSSPYAVSKIGVDYLSYFYSNTYKMKIVITRGFSQTGPRRGEVFAESSFAKQIAEIEKGKKEPVIMVGNLEARRDYTDVRDIVNGYLLAIEKGIPGEVYNICSGKSIKIKKVLDILISLSKVKVEVKQDPERMRSSDVLVFLGDNSKFVKQTGWKPLIPFKKTMEDLLNYWREKI